MQYSLRSHGVTWFITSERDGEWELSWEEDGVRDASGFYEWPEMAASDVYAQVTGCDTWDNLPPMPIEIEDLTNWRRDIEHRW